MKFLKRSERARPRLSLILADWGVRESFHLLHYLRNQTARRDDFEVLVVEFYGRRSPALEAFADDVDTWLLLEMPQACCYHKHLIYNAGIALARGDIVAIADSDAMVRETFVQSILETFETDPNIVLHLDQFRNNRQDLYPFRYPDFDDVLGAGCINDAGGTTLGLADRRDPLHRRNYGACMAARRDDLLAIGGADEHIEYAGHVCGPYEMTFRLFNAGRRELWHRSEFTYHTWHPGQAGVGNYQGPHDGRQMARGALQALTSWRVRPWLENGAIRLLREGKAAAAKEDLLEALVDPRHAEDWRYERIARIARQSRWTEMKFRAGPIHYRGFRIEPHERGFRASPIAGPERQAAAQSTLYGDSPAAILSAIDRSMPFSVDLLGKLGESYVWLEHGYRKLFRWRTAA